MVSTGGSTQPEWSPCVLSYWDLQQWIPPWIRVQRAVSYHKWSTYLLSKSMGTCFNRVGIKRWKLPQPLCTSVASYFSLQPTRTFKAFVRDRPTTHVTPPMNQISLRSFLVALLPLVRSSSSSVRRRRGWCCWLTPFYPPFMERTEERLSHLWSNKFS